MIKKGLVSVVITTYNRDPKILREAIESVLGQSYKDLELIVVDDNGMNTPCQMENEEIMKIYGHSVFYKANDVNSGVQFSRNRGILESSGEFVAFLDDDDVWVENKIQEQINIFKDVNVGLVYCNGYRFYDDEKQDVEPYQSYRITGENITFDMMLDNDYVGSTSHPLIRKECFAKVGLFDLNMPARQDYEMWLRISKGGYKIIGIEQALFYYRCHRGERISTNNKKCYVGYQNLLNMYHKEYRKHRYSKSNKILKLCKHSYGMKKYASSLCHLFHAFFVHPKQVLDTVIRKTRKK